CRGHIIDATAERASQLADSATKTSFTASTGRAISHHLRLIYPLVTEHHRLSPEWYMLDLCDIYIVLKNMESCCGGKLSFLYIQTIKVIQ
ncbi:hypothetical protein MKX01_020851, partial [Papaver californicum]